MNIRTTDGTLEEYSVEKVFNDIVESYKSIKEEVDEHLIRNIIDNLFVYENMTSVEIRRLVEDALMSINKKVARAYISKYDTIDSDKNFKRKKSDYIKNYIKASNAATGSKFDANANVSNKNVVTMDTELYKEENIKENRYLLYDRIKMLYSKKLADRYIYDLETHRIYKHDETAIPGMPYCVAITMYPFLLDGLTGLGGQSKAPTDLKSYCGEFINLVYSVSSQFAGAVATPEFLMYFDYFIRKDYGDDYILHLNDKVELNTKGRTLEQVIENGFQQVVHSMNMPAGNRGYQCVREDTTQLMTPNGFKYLSDLNEGDCCYVWKDGKLCIEKINKLNVYDFDGEMYQFKGRNYQQTVTDSHRVLYKKPSTSTYSIKEAKDLFGHSKLSLPVGSDGIDREDFPITDELLKLCVITLTDGSIDGVIDGDINSGRIKIYKSKNRWGFKEIPELLNSIGVGFTENEIYGNEFGDMVSFTIPKIDSQIILRQIEHTKKRLPKFMKLLSKRQIDIVIDIWSKTDGSNRNGDIYLQCDNDEILNDLQEIVFLGGYGSMIKKSVVNKFNGDGNTLTNHLHIFKRKDKRVSEYNKIYYKGRVWCPSTDAGIVIFREENGIPYITGNSVFWNVGYFDKGYFEGVFGDFKFPDGTSPKWETLSWLQKKFMKWFNDERTRYTLTFPVETMACLTDGNDLVDVEYADFTAEMYADGHSFFTYLSDSPDSLSSCCRLRNSLKDNEDEEHNHNTHQFSMGTASVATGSKSVMTINLNRIIQNSVVEYFEEMGSKFQLGCKFVLSEQSEDVKQGVINKIKSNITECTENVHKYQTAFNSIIKDFYEANMLDVYRAGFINMRKQYLTVGVNGLTDAAEFLGIDCTDNDNYREFVNDILETINISNKKDKTRECMFNTEFVPGENLSNKNYNWDKKDGYFVSEKHIMYSSYFFNPEDESLSVLEKMRLHGKDYVQYLDGGSACHINLAEHLSKEQNRKLLKYAASVGCNYFTYNVRNTACNKCGYISKHDLDKCPHCGSTDVDKLTRIIGYLKRVKSFAEPRQVEEGMRYYNKTVE